MEDGKRKYIDGELERRAIELVRDGKTTNYFNIDATDFDLFAEGGYKEVTDPFDREAIMYGQRNGFFDKYVKENPDFDFNDISDYNYEKNYYLPKSDEEVKQYEEKKSKQADEKYRKSRMQGAMSSYLDGSLFGRKKR